MNKKFLLVAFVLLIGAAAAFAQTDAHDVVIHITDIAALGLNENVTDVEFSTAAPANPGEAVGPDVGTPATNTDKRLWYTALNAAGLTRRITVGSSANPPAGTALTVLGTVATTPQEGTSLGTVNVSTTTVDLVNAIPSVATGRTGTDGTGLTYSFWVTTPASLVQGDYTLTVTYTLTDDA